MTIALLPTSVYDSAMLLAATGKAMDTFHGKTLEQREKS